MGTTHIEKESWKKRIELRCEREIDQLCAEREPDFQSRMNRDVLQTTLRELEISAQKLQIHEFELQVLEIDRQRSVLDDQRQSVRRKISMLHAEIACILKLEPDSSGYGEGYKASQAIEKHKQAVTRRLMANDPLGKQIIQFRHERDALLDLVSLATTKAQFQQIWDRYQTMLNNDEPPKSGFGE